MKHIYIILPMVLAFYCAKEAKAQTGFTFQTKNVAVIAEDDFGHGASGDVWGFKKSGSPDKHYAISTLGGGLQITIAHGTSPMHYEEVAYVNITENTSLVFADVETFVVNNTVYAACAIASKVNPVVYIVNVDSAISLGPAARTILFRSATFKCQPYRILILRPKPTQSPSQTTVCTSQRKRATSIYGTSPIRTRQFTKVHTRFRFRYRAQTIRQQPCMRCMSIPPGVAIARMSHIRAAVCSLSISILRLSQTAWYSSGRCTTATSEALSPSSPQTRLLITEPAIAPGLRMIGRTSLRRMKSLPRPRYFRFKERIALFCKLRT